MTTHLMRTGTKAKEHHRRSEMERMLAEVAVAGPAAIDERLRELSSEWSTGRLTKAVAGTVVLSGLMLGIVLSPWFVVLSAVGGVMLAWYAVGRRSWIAALLHAAGFRTGTEIHEEMLALKALRGDFRHLPTVHEIEDKDAISRFEGEGGTVYESEDVKVDSRDAAREVLTAARI
jgi:hypothetical protein